MKEFFKRLAETLVIASIGMIAVLIIVAIIFTIFPIQKEEYKMDVLLMLVGAIISAGVGYAIGLIFDNNKAGANFVPGLWGALGLFFGFQGLLIGIIYGLLKLLYYSRR